jgi:hypothetical protein
LRNQQSRELLLMHPGGELNTPAHLHQSGMCLVQEMRELNFNGRLARPFHLRLREKVRCGWQRGRQEQVEQHGTTQGPDQALTAAPK